jgi:hypothetical protein
MATPKGGRRKPSTRPGVVRAKKLATRRRNEATCGNCGASGKDTFLDLHGRHHPEQPHLRLGNMCSSGYSNASIDAEITRCIAQGDGWRCRGCHVREDRGDSVKAAAQLSAAKRAAAPEKRCGRCRRTTSYLSRNNMCKRCQGNANKKA